MEAEPTKAAPPKRKRRRFQFRLRTLMIGVAVFAAACAYAVHQRELMRERQEFFGTHGVCFFAEMSDDEKGGDQQSPAMDGRFRL